MNKCSKCNNIEYRKEISKMNLEKIVLILLAVALFLLSIVLLKGIFTEYNYAYIELPKNASLKGLPCDPLLKGNQLVCNQKTTCCR